MTDKKKASLLLVTLLVLLPLVFFAGLFLGSERIPLLAMLSALFEPEAEGSAFFYRLIMLRIRLPRTVLALLAGALLAGAGAVFQGFFKSPLADSSLLGVSSGAALGAVLGSLTGLYLPLAAFGGAVASIVAVYLLSGGRGAAREPVRLLLAGSALSMFLSAVNSTLLLLHDRELYKMYSWTLGSFNGKGFAELAFMLPTAFVSIVLMVLCVKPLDIISAGDATAQGLGLSVGKTRLLVFAAGSLAAGTAVSVSGVIGFVGLVAPHVVRVIAGATYKRLLPLSMLLGAVFLVLCDVVARILVPPMEIPVGILTSLCGAPFFIAILMSHRDRYLT